MGFIETRQDIIASVKEQTDIVKIIGEHVDLKRSGVRYLGLCPFHGEKTPSFSVHGEQQFYYCFGCGESGDVFSFLMKYHNLDFQSALKQLADRLNIALPKKAITEQERQKEAVRDKMYAVSKKVAMIYRRYLVENSKSDSARRYLLDRGIPEEVQKEFGVGYAPAKQQEGWDFLAKQLSVEEGKVAEQLGLLVKSERGGRYDRFRDRVLFPIYDVQGRICGFGGRIVGEGQPKYMNSPESYIFNKSRHLLGLYQQSDAIRSARKVVVVEGNFDMISLVVHGCSNVVAPLGTALTASQIRLLKKYAGEAVLLFDGDDAGKKAAYRAAPLFLAEKMQAKVALLPKDHDPDTYVRQFGLEAIHELLEQAKELAEFVVDELIEMHGVSLEGKTKIAEEMKPLVSAASSQLQRSVVIAHFAEKLGLRTEQLTTLMEKESGVLQSAVSTERKKSQISAETEKLTAVQKRLIEFVVMHPHYLKELEGKNLREILQGGMGEILFLQVKMLLMEKDEVQPEDILSTLPEGPERTFVADTLLQAPQLDTDDAAEHTKNELMELLEWLEIKELKEISKNLSRQIEKAQNSGNNAELMRLLQEKQSIELQLRKLEE